MKKTSTVTQKSTAEQPKGKDMYKLTFGNFKGKKEAIEQLTTVKKKFTNASLIIEGNCYKIFFGEYDKAAGEKALAMVKEAGIKAELV